MSEKDPPPSRAVVLHGAGYVGIELCNLLLNHPSVELGQASSRSLAGQPLWKADPRLRSYTELTFSDPSEINLTGVDVLFSCAEHGAAAAEVIAAIGQGFGGVIIDLSADFRLSEAADYPTHYGFVHPDPALLAEFEYALPELRAPYPQGCRRLANPGCFATGLALAAAPLAKPLDPLRASITALTGASGSGARAKPGTHFPRRDGSVSAYKVFKHQHLPEVMQCLEPTSRLDFAPASGPWTRGIWGTLHTQIAEGADVDGWFEQAYGDSTFVRLTPGSLPVMREVVGTPFCDIGWVVHDSALVVGFALDNLLKGAASQAIQNMNLSLGYSEATGLLPA